MDRRNFVRMFGAGGLALAGGAAVAEASKGKQGLVSVYRTSTAVKGLVPKQHQKGNDNFHYDCRVKAFKVKVNTPGLVTVLSQHDYKRFLGERHDGVSVSTVSRERVSGEATYPLSEARYLMDDDIFQACFIPDDPTAKVSFKTVLCCELSEYIYDTRNLKAPRMRKYDKESAANAEEREEISLSMAKLIGIVGREDVAPQKRGRHRLGMVGLKIPRPNYASVSLDDVNQIVKNYIGL